MTENHAAKAKQDGKRPLVLGFDTSAAHCAAALLDGDRIVAHRHEDMGRGQAERLMPLLQEVLAEAGATWTDLDAIGVGIGPGNFTGIRIAVSAARGLALGLRVPAVGVSTLEAQTFGQPGVVVSVLDARRGKIYLQVFGDPSPSAPALCGLDDLPPIPARAKPAVVGFEADRIAERCAGHRAAPLVPLAEAIARIAAARRFSVTEPPAPLYLRAADAAPSGDRPPVLIDE